jgi:hypothetical protein
MLRNFGLDAAAKAEILSENFKRQTFSDAAELWQQLHGRTVVSLGPMTLLPRNIPAQGPTERSDGRRNPCADIMAQPTSGTKAAPAPFCREAIN